MKSSLVKKKTAVEKTMKKEGWVHLASPDLELWGKGRNRILYCPKCGRIYSQFTSKKKV